ncbi:MAG: O-antigen ligase family protein [Dehalococcoidia bacterium]|nr:O-antigen ligase family protein [Dehalococcoidia bacterium]
MGTILAMGPRRLTVYLAVPAIMVGLPALAATGSRSGLLGFLLAGFLMVMLAPVQRYTKLRLATFGLIGVTIGLGLLMLQGGSDFERIKSLTLGIRVLGQREFLIRAGWEMWKDNPFIGVGTGSYQNALVQSYMWVIPWWAETTLSHTSFISLLAEGAGRHLDARIRARPRGERSLERVPAGDRALRAADGSMVRRGADRDLLPEPVGGQAVRRAIPVGDLRDLRRG